MCDDKEKNRYPEYKKERDRLQEEAKAWLFYLNTAASLVAFNFALVLFTITDHTLGVILGISTLFFYITLVDHFSDSIFPEGINKLRRVKDSSESSHDTDKKKHNKKLLAAIELFLMKNRPLLFILSNYFFLSSLLYHVFQFLLSIDILYNPF